MGSKAEQTKLRLLNAAREIVFQEGAPSLTHELLAEKSGLSKGGVLYHFPTKVSLLGGVVGTFFEDFEREVERRYESGCRPWLRAYLRASFPENRVGLHRESRALFALMSLEPSLLAVAQERFQGWHLRAQVDTEDRAKAALVRSAIDGLWYNEMFGLHLPKEQLRDLLETLEGLIAADDGAS